MKRFAKSPLLLLLALGLLLSASPAAADKKGDQARARAAWQQGKALFEKGDYKGAYGQFHAGYKLSGRGGFLYNMAECKRLLGQKAGARALYSTYLERFPRGSSRRDAEAQLKALGGPLEPKLAEPKPTAKPKQPEATPPPKQPEATPPPKQPATATPAKKPANQPTAAHQKPFLPKQQKTARSSDEGSQPIYKKWWFWTGIAAVAAAAGGVTAGVMLSKDDLPAHDYRVDLR